jgi:hypothetical protein
MPAPPVGAVPVFEPAGELQPVTPAPPAPPPPAVFLFKSFAVAQADELDPPPLLPITVPPLDVPPLKKF